MNNPCSTDTEEEDDEYLGADMDANDYFMKIDPAGKDLKFYNNLNLSFKGNRKQSCEKKL